MRTSRDHRIDKAAQALLTAISAERKYRRASSEFLASARNLDQREIIHAAADLLADRGISLNGATVKTIWHETRRVFGWRDIAELDARGSA
jgi:hypothetical protein